MQQFATRIGSKTADGSALRKQIGMPIPSLDPSPTIAAAAPPAPPTLGEAKIGLTADDPRRRAMRAAGASETILGQKLG